MLNKTTFALLLCLLTWCSSCITNCSDPQDLTPYYMVRNQTQEDVMIDLYPDVHFQQRLVVIGPAAISSTGGYGTFETDSAIIYNTRDTVVFYNKHVDSLLFNKSQAINFYNKENWKCEGDHCLYTFEEEFFTQMDSIQTSE